MSRYKITYVFEEEVIYSSKEEAESNSREWAEDIADENGITEVSVKAEEYDDAA